MAPRVLKNASQMKGRPQHVCTPRYLFGPIARFLAPCNRGGTLCDGSDADLDVLDDEQLYVDLDPCWNRDSPVRAHVTWTVRDDGLSREWSAAFDELVARDLVDAGPPGTIFCNPPWEDLEPWLERCAAARDHAEVIALVPLRPHRKSFARAFSADAWCLLPPVAFAGEENAIPVPCVLLYWGRRAEAFCRFFCGGQRWQGMVLTRDAWRRNVSRTMKRYPDYRRNAPKTKKKAEPKKPHPAVHALARILKYAFRNYFADDDDIDSTQWDERRDWEDDPIIALVEAFMPGERITRWTRPDDVVRAIANVLEPDSNDCKIAETLERVFYQGKTLFELAPEGYGKHLEQLDKKASATATAKAAAATRAAKKAAKAKGAKKPAKKVKVKAAPKKKAPPKPKTAKKPAGAKAKPKLSTVAAIVRKAEAGKVLTPAEETKLVLTGQFTATSHPDGTRYVTDRDGRRFAVQRGKDYTKGGKAGGKRQAELPGTRSETLDEVVDALAGDDEDEGTDAYRQPGAATSTPGPAQTAAPKNGHKKPAPNGHGKAAADDLVRAALGRSGETIDVKALITRLGTSKATVIRALNQLKKDKVVRLEGGGRGARWVVQ